MNVEGKKSASTAAAAALRKYQAALSLQSDVPSATPSNVLHWRSIGEHKNVTGYAVSSELFAFLGTEARIKTHLLKTIAGYYSTSSVSLNGIPLTSPPMNSSMVDVQDAINLYDSLTVLETLGFSAELRLGRHNHSHSLRHGTASNSGSPARVRRGSIGGVTVGHSEMHSHHQPAELLAVRLLTEMGQYPFQTYTPSFTLSLPPPPPPLLFTYTLLSWNISHPIHQVWKTSLRRVWVICPCGSDGWSSSPQKSSPARTYVQCRPDPSHILLLSIHPLSDITMHPCKPLTHDNPSSPSLHHPLPLPLPLSLLGIVLRPTHFGPGCTVSAVARHQVYPTLINPKT